jgi:EmrB/QacA subfamily drug resistance transporter
MDKRISASVKREKMAYKWVVLCVVLFGVFMSLLDQTIVSIAVPRLQHAFNTSIENIQWVVTAYILTLGIFTPAVAFLSRRFGIKRIYILSLVAFTLSSALCGWAWNLPSLICFRILQGIGGAALFPLANALLLRVFPPEQRGLAMGFYALPALLAPTLGPTLGGYLITYADWPSIFFVNVPIGLLAVFLSVKFLRELDVQKDLPFDLLGFVLVAIGLGLVFYALSDASITGWGSFEILSLLAAGCTALAVFVGMELRRERNHLQPLLHLSLFRNGPFLFSMLATVFLTVRLQSATFLFPLYLQESLGQTALQAGLMLLPYALASGVASLIGGRLVDRLGARVVILLGVALLIVCTWQLTFIALDSPFWWLQTLLIVQGLALGLCYQPLIVTATAEVPPQRMALATTMNTLTRALSSSLGIAVIVTVVQIQSQVHSMQLTKSGRQAASSVASLSFVLALQDAFFLLTVVTILALLAVLFLRGRRKQLS